MLCVPLFVQFVTLSEDSLPVSAPPYLKAASFPANNWYSSCLPCRHNAVWPYTVTPQHCTQAVSRRSLHAACTTSRCVRLHLAKEGKCNFRCAGLHRSHSCCCSNFTVERTGGETYMSLETPEFAKFNLHRHIFVKNSYTDFHENPTNALAANTGSPTDRDCRGGVALFFVKKARTVCILPTQCIYVFCVDLRTNSDYFPIQH
jgi:hypothetical protein